ncbi:MAG: arginase family protein [Chloroflexota bacterium]
MQVDLVTIPYRYDAADEGLGLGPAALVAAGLAARLAAVGVDLGPPRRADLPDADRVPDNPAVNIGRLGARTADLVAASVAGDRRLLVLAGDDTAAVGIVAGVQQAAPGDRIGLAWIDAHGDFNTPETSFSGILAGMPVAIIAGLAGPRWREAAGLRHPIPTERILAAGVRELDEKEEGLLQATTVRVVRSADLADLDAFTALAARFAGRCDRLCVHVDLDVLDPRFVPSASTPSAGGLTPDEAGAVVGALLSTGKAATLSIAGLNPGAGARGAQSTASALALLAAALPAWTAPGAG